MKRSTGISPLDHPPFARHGHLLQLEQRFAERLQRHRADHAAEQQGAEMLSRLVVGKLLPGERQPERTAQDRLA
jgi:hypothetical protein